MGPRLFILFNLPKAYPKIRPINSSACLFPEDIPRLKELLKKQQIIYPVVAFLDDYDYKSYSERLTQFGVDAKVIQEEFNKTGKKTLLVDMIDSGQSITSFLSVLEMDAKLKGIKWNPEAVKIVSIRSPDMAADPTYQNRIFQSLGGNFYPEEEFIIPKKLLLAITFNRQRHPDVPEYYKDKWGMPDYVPTGLQYNAYSSGRPISPATYDGYKEIMTTLHKEADETKVTDVVSDMVDAMQKSQGENVENYYKRLKKRRSNQHGY